MPKQNREQNNYFFTNWSLDLNFWELEHFVLFFTNNEFYNKLIAEETNKYVAEMHKTKLHMK